MVTTLPGNCIVYMYTLLNISHLPTCTGLKVLFNPPRVHNYSPSSLVTDFPISEIPSHRDDYISLFTAFSSLLLEIGSSDKGQPLFFGIKGTKVVQQCHTYLPPLRSAIQTPDHMWESWWLLTDGR